MKTVEYNEQDLQEMASVISKLSLADTFKLIKILDKEYGINIVNNVVEKSVGGPAYCGDYVHSINDNNRLFKVSIINVGPYKLQVVKTIKELTGLGLKESKDLVDIVDIVGSSLIKECEGFEAEMIKNKLVEAGALVTIK